MQLLVSELENIVMETIHDTALSFYLTVSSELM